MNVFQIRLMKLLAEHFRSNCASMYSIGLSANKVVSLAEYELGSNEWRADAPSSPKRESGASPRPHRGRSISLHHTFILLYSHPTLSAFYEVRSFEGEEALYDRQVQTSTKLGSSVLNQLARLAPATQFALRTRPLGLRQLPETITIGAVRPHTPPEFRTSHSSTLHPQPTPPTSSHHPRRLIAILSGIQCAPYLYPFDLVVATTLQSFWFFYSLPSP